MFLLLFFISLVFAQDIVVYASPVLIFKDGQPTANEFGHRISYSLAARHIRYAKVKSEYGWEYIGNSDYFSIWNKDTIKTKFKNCNYQTTPYKCSVKNKHYYVQAAVDLREDEGVISFELYDPRGQLINSSYTSNKKIIRWIKQQEILVFKGGYHLPKEELPLKWEIPYRIFRDDFDQASALLWTGVKLK